eukprot:gnl/MRDRNA2_/MRDRNA2_200025_c0_seq1.p1 gnl/MRDRNA2_/MRDRNA2_200025_c0~~gnl/MRDRNA2_/MRDRNA2_200025_c0_seq1.p1  ORF type:complete len:167 (-),score=32.69 gnl/MRDRNA2_/MRDRNA2_200025_c0_seq1:155-655(-)
MMLRSRHTGMSHGFAMTNLFFLYVLGGVLRVCGDVPRRPRGVPKAFQGVPNAFQRRPQAIPRHGETTDDESTKKEMSNEQVIDSLWGQFVPKGEQYMQKSQYVNLLKLFGELTKTPFGAEKFSDEEWKHLCELAAANPDYGLTKEQLAKVFSDVFEHHHAEKRVEL